MSDAMQEVLGKDPETGNTIFQDFNDVGRDLLTLGMRLAERLKRQQEQIEALRSRIESLERAQGFKPGTSMHAAWKENE